MKPVVYIHTNDRHLLSARVGAYSVRARSRYSDAFEIRLLRVEETPRLCAREGQRYVWNGGVRIWRRSNHEAFMPLRRLVPQLMDFRGRALVLDPDVFAVGDVHELLSGAARLLTRAGPGGGPHVGVFTGRLRPRRSACDQRGGAVLVGNRSRTGLRHYGRRAMREKVALN